MALQKVKGGEGEREGGRKIISRIKESGKIEGLWL